MSDERICYAINLVRGRSIFFIKPVMNANSHEYVRISTCLGLVIKTRGTKGTINIVIVVTKITK